MFCDKIKARTSVAKIQKGPYRSVLLGLISLNFPVKNTMLQISFCNTSMVEAWKNCW